MKKWISVLAVLCMVAIVLAGCADTNTFKAPENYASVLQVTINPTANLYLDADNVILAIEYVNADAKDTYEAIEKDLIGAPLDKGLDKVVEAAAAKGFLQAEKQMTLDVIKTEEGAAETKANEVLQVANVAVQAAVEKQQLEVEVKTQVKGEAVTPAPIVTTVVTTTDTETTTVATTVATTAKPTTKATTAKPTTKAPTTKAKAEISVGKEYVMYLPNPDTDEVLTGCYFQFKADGSYSYHQVPFLNDPYGEGEHITYNGKVYYVAGGGAGSGGTYTISGDTLTLAGGEDMVFTVNSKTKLTVKKPDSVSTQFKAGDVFTVQ